MRISTLNMIQLTTLAFLTFVITLAHAAAPQKDTIYTVQLGLFDNVTIADFDELRKAGYIYAEPLSTEGRQAIFVSNFQSKNKAENVLVFAKSKGYEDAFITERPLIKGEKVYVVQVASRTSRDYINWNDYAGIGQLHMLLDEKAVKITSVPFRDIEKAKEKQMILQTLGFDDAFVKATNTLMLHKVNTFNTIKEIDFEPKAISADMAKNEEGVMEVPADEWAYVVPESLSPSPDDFLAKGPNTISKESRQSVKSLQKFLKKQAAYAGEDDGIYGKGTASGVGYIEKNTPQYSRYIAMVGENSRNATAKEMNELDALIISIPTNTKETYAELGKQRSPMAKVYRAYILFMADQEANRPQINELMNNAIREAYFQFEGEAPFDYNSAYDYSDLEQLILHTRYVQAALNEEPITPCWLFNKHKDVAYSAFAKAEAQGIRNNNMQHCSGFMQWDNIILLKTIASDLNAAEGELTAEMKKRQRAADAQLNKYYMIPRPLDKDMETGVVKWNDQLWSSLDLKMSEDKFFAKFGVPFKLAYHKSWIQLEDFYMEKGFKKYQANGLALAVLKSIVENDVEGYLN